jgi:hypothetical protein
MSFAAEDQLLIQCSRVKMDDEAIAIASILLREGLGWDYIVEASIRHGVSPLFYHGLNQLGQTVELDRLVPSSAMKKLQELYLGNQVRNRRLYRVIGDIFNAFEQAGIQAMGLKDVQLTREVYPDIGLRPMGDIDILIHAEDYGKVATCMTGLGFGPLPDPNILYTLKYAWGHHFRRPDDNVWVDVQWNVLQKEWDAYHEGNFDFEIDRMWRGANLMTIDDCRILVPKPEDMLFHLCLHLEGHGYAELILFCDIVEMLRYYERQLDWQYFIDIGHKYGAESSIYYVLRLIQRLFRVPLPPLLLQELKPAYFKANMFRPLFGNLTPLHLSLDGIRLAAFPPDEVMNEFETVVRQQAASASCLFREIDNIASAFTKAEGSVIILNGTSSEKVFPDPALRPFEEVRFFILNHDLRVMRQTLSNCGFKTPAAYNPEIYRKECGISSADPLLANRPTCLVLQGNVETSLDHLFRQNGSQSKKDVALKSIKTKLTGPKNDNASVPVQFKIVALSPEDMMLYLAAWLGKVKQNRLFRLNTLLEFFRNYSAPLDWQLIARKAQQYGISELVDEGLLMVSELVDNGQLPLTALPLCAGPISHPRVLEWARYGPLSLDLYTDLKRPFFYLFSFLSVAGMRAKFRYLLRSLVGYQGNVPILPGLALELTTGMLSLMRRKQRAIRDFAYWVETDLTLETTPGSDERK